MIKRLQTQKKIKTITIWTEPIKIIRIKCNQTTQNRTSQINCKFSVNVAVIIDSGKKKKKDDGVLISILVKMTRRKVLQFHIESNIHETIRWNSFFLAQNNYLHIFISLNCSISFPFIEMKTNRKFCTTSFCKFNFFLFLVRNFLISPDMKEHEQHLQSTLYMTFLRISLRSSAISVI